MAVMNEQKLSFLGGLVSPSLYLRSDLEKFGKWFSKADNIRFYTVGAFENRFGTVHIATTKDNLSGRIIKLVKFVYNSNESCLLEFGNNYCRVYKNTSYITEISTTINPNTDGDIKYAQSADTIFIATNKGLYELIRTSKDFTTWIFRNFNWNNGISPLDEENDNSSKTLSLTTITSSAFIVQLRNNDDDSGYFYNPKVVFTISGVDTTIYEYTSGRISYSDFETAINSLISSYDLTASINNNSLVFTVNTSTTVDDIKVTYSVYSLNQSSSSTNPCTFSTYDKLYRITFTKAAVNYGSYMHGDAINEDYTVNATITDNLSDMADNITSQFPTYSDTGVKKYNIEVSGDTATLKYLNGLNPVYYAFSDVIIKNVTWYYYSYDTITETATLDTIASQKYTATATFDFFENKQPNETFAIVNTVEASNIHATYTGSAVNYQKNNGTATTTPPTFLSDGNWRYNSSGLWNGTVNLYYSKDNGASWIKFFTRTNDAYNQYSTTNDNTSGTIETGDLILMKMEAIITAQDGSSKFNAELACKQFDINSYYKIYTITDEDTATVYCIKNDVGELTNMDSWRDSAFSASKGYPTAIGFYQNRLFLGKEYMIYGSASNDFWDFYEPTSVKDSDPITMSLLGYQVDSIQNIVTVRSFFVFTTGGEFGIGSEGALTQADKYLKQLSAHGSSNCNPIFCGDIIVFVDASGNTVRAFQYSLDVDSYEATDMSVLVEQVLKGKTIKTTEYLKHTKECLFLTTDGDVYVFKFYQEQNIAAWSKWRHAKYNITNLCVVPSSNNTEILYVAMNTTKGEKVIEKFVEGQYCDSLHTYTSVTATDTFTTDFEKDDVVVVDDGVDSNYLVTVGDDGEIQTRNESTSITVGLRYISEATLLSPEIQLQDGVFTTFNKKRPFNVHLFYRDSYGFKVGVEDFDTQEIQYQDIHNFIDQEDELDTGKAKVLVPARFEGNSRVTFVQQLPYPMVIENVMIDTDYGGKQ